MGLFSRLAGKIDPARENVNESINFSIDAEIIGPSAEGLVKLSGTTTFAKAAVTSMLDRHVIADRGMLLIDGALHREPNNPVDPSAVAVHVEGERVGYLPGYIAALVNLPTRASRSVPVQFFYARQANGAWRGEAWTWLSNTAPRWQYTESAPPPLTAANPDARTLNLQIA